MSACSFWKLLGVFFFSEDKHELVCALPNPFKLKSADHNIEIYLDDGNFLIFITSVGSTITKFIQLLMQVLWHEMELLVCIGDLFRML